MTAPLSGLRVLDLSWVMVGPFSARYLADLGADVVKVESSRRIDPLRTLGPFKDAQPGPERSVSYHNLNAGKRSLALDLKSPQGRDVVLKLVGWADVVVESFTPHVLRGLSLTYADLIKVRADLIMVSTSIGGQTGPYANEMMGVGTMGASLSGATHLIGWPDRRPTGPFGPWTDEVAPRFIVASVLAALHRRRRSGEGGYIDISQAEAGMQFISPASWAFAASGEVLQRRGAIDPLRCPSGSFPSKGTDQWIAIDASSGETWSKLRTLIGGELLWPTFDTIVGRLRDRETVEAGVAAWTAQRTADAAEVALQRAGVPAHAVVRAAAIAADEDVRACGHLQPITDAVIGDAEIEGPRFRFTTTPLPPVRRGPRIGEHTAQILMECAGLTGADCARLAEEGVLA